jgi:hypothetical protein
MPLPACRPITASSAAAMLALALAATPATDAGAVEQAGVSAAVRGQVTRETTLEEGGPDAPRRLEPGSAVFRLDRITSGPDARTQVLLRDQSSFKLAPESELVIDEFVYDPQSGSGELVAEAAEGALRFVSGKIAQADPDQVTLETPTATIGIRGTMLSADLDARRPGAARRDDGAGGSGDGADGTAGPRHALFVLTGPGVENNAGARRGAITVSAAGETVTIRRTGWGTYVPQGGPPSQPQPVPPAALRRLDTQLASRATRGGTGEGDPTGGEVQEQGAESAAGQSGAAAQDAGQALQQGQQQAAAVADIASGDEFGDAPQQQPQQQPVLLEPGSSPVDTFNNVGQPVSDWATVERAITEENFQGVVEATASDIKMVDLSATSEGAQFDPANQSINVLDTAGLERLGSYDVTFRADFTARDFTARFENIEVDAAQLAGASVAQQAGFQAGIGYITFSADSAGSFGVTAGGGCQDAGCSAAIDLLARDGKPIGGVAHSLLVQGIAGAGSLETRAQ